MPSLQRLVPDGDYFVSREYALANALEHFILPLIQQEANYTVRSAKERVVFDRNRDISAEAQELMVALRRYVESIVFRSPEVHDTRNTGVLDEESASHYDSPETTLQDCQNEVSVAPDSPDEEGAIEYRIVAPLDEERDIVFNKMPIRLLMFNADGSAIRLVDRQELFHHIETCDDTTMYISYAILSHTWLQHSYGEVTYTDWIGNTVNKNSRGYIKLANFCRTVATHYGIRLAWMDTVCIDKESSAELDESIRSMYKWYQLATVCLVYLVDTESPENMVDDRWFTRGWTLQELIAPRRIHFFNTHWKKMVENYSDNWQTDTISTTSAPTLSEASKISEDELEACCLQSPTVIPIWRRMQWAAKRNVTREEDMAYSLMGIFDVSISTAYGEGKERAFYRLIREILNINTPRALELINWGYGFDLSQTSMTPRPPSALIPSSPKRYTWSAKNIEWPIPSVPLTLSHLGLCVRMLLMPSFGVTRQNYLQRQKSSGPELSAHMGSYYATAGPIKIRTGYNIEASELIDKYFDILHRRTITVDEHVSVFAVINFEETSNTVTLPKVSCFALLDWRPSQVLSGKILDEYRFSMTTVNDVITFGMKTRDEASLIIPKANLAMHGMVLHTDYV